MKNSKSPIDTKRSMHIVLKSSKAVGKLSLATRENRNFIQDLLGKCSRKYEIKIYNFANVANHLHFLVRAKDRKKFIAFMRYFTSQVALFILKAKKGCSKGSLWTQKLFLRPVSWGKDFSNVMFYILDNVLQGRQAKKNLDIEEFFSLHPPWL